MRRSGANAACERERRRTAADRAGGRTASNSPRWGGSCELPEWYRPGSAPWFERGLGEKRVSSERRPHRPADNRGCAAP